jgi:hypothetical protein
MHPRRCGTFPLHDRIPSYGSLARLGLTFLGTGLSSLEIRFRVGLPLLRLMRQLFTDARTLPYFKEHGCVRSG